MRLSVLPLFAACLLLPFSACRGGRNDMPDWEKALVELDESLAHEATPVTGCVT